ncbi:hypothetical protein [Microvirga aerophila]|uniref:Uncharacterized protein n=1 Tax=Microvirga aerophila TaxID=670291 RepID=A0A512BLM5_9HYPH|nr:hypothetical protein [Microvirga aerophila]GEO12866.1 hypothetical protein MAE02_05620 [Microvirga aerophila]
MRLSSSGLDSNKTQQGSSNKADPAQRMPETIIVLVANVLIDVPLHASLAWP